MSDGTVVLVHYCLACDLNWHSTGLAGACPKCGETEAPAVRLNRPARVEPIWYPEARDILDGMRTAEH